MKMEGQLKTPGFSSDPNLLPRIRQVVEALKTTDANDVAGELQQLYPEYSRKKRRAFVELVRRGIQRVETSEQLNSSSLPMTSASATGNRKRRAENGTAMKAVVTIDDDHSNSSMDEKLDTYINYPDTNMTNKALTNLYTRKSNILPKKEEESSATPISNKNGQTSKKRPPRPTPGTIGLGSVPSITVALQRPTVKFGDLGGCESQFLDVCRLAMHLKHPEIHRRLGVTPARGFLLHGPPGCGKTLFAEAVAGELELPLLRLAGTELISGVSGESEEKMRALFEQALSNAPCVLFIDEIDAIAPRRETAQREMERRIVSQLIACLDDLGRMPSDGTIDDRSNKDGTIDGRSNNHVLVIGATNRPDSIEPALRRAGRFDKEIALGIPDERARRTILPIVCKDIRVDESVQWSQIARLTPGYVGADLRSLAREAAMCAVNRQFEMVIQSSNTGTMKRQPTIEEVNGELQRMLTWLKSDQDLDETRLTDLFVNRSDFDRAISIVHPSAKREGFATVPDVTWDDIGALKTVRDQLQWSILYPIKQPEEFERFAVSVRAQGILLCGPPGCGKTLLAKAVANETGMNFISVKGPELLSMYVGESERAVRIVFQRARDSSPCVIFFDEIDALCPRRSHSETTGSARLVNQLLTEMDGLEERKQVFLIGATNRPDIVDTAVLRPGRLDKILFVDFPDHSDREDILRKATKNGTRPQLDIDVDLNKIANDKRLEWFTGADLVALVREASVAALKERLQTGTSCNQVCSRHFDNAMNTMRPSVSEPDRRKYSIARTMYMAPGQPVLDPGDH